jgi:hypothetical protein
MPHAEVLFGLFALASAVVARDSGLNIWPLPLDERVSGAPLALAPSFVIVVDSNSSSSLVAADAVARYNSFIASKQARARASAGLATAAAAAAADAAPAADVAADAAGATPLLRRLTLTLDSANDTLVNWEVDESYTLEVVDGSVSEEVVAGGRQGQQQQQQQQQQPTARAHARTPFGGLRALESFYQLLGGGGGDANANRTAAAADGLSLPGGSIRIADAPTYAHRSLLIDVGRRLYPVAFVKSILDAMSYAKLNVLHLHLNDMGRFAWESRVYPELNTGYCMLGRCDGTYWRQAEVRELVAHARLRGVRLVPELEMSTHARALVPLVKTQGLVFCNDSFPIVLYDDPAGAARKVIQALLAEMADLFDDEVLHLGMDEMQCHYSDPAAKDPLDVGMCGLQQPRPRCNASSVRALQHDMLAFAAGPALRARMARPRPLRPMAWHNVFTDCGDLGGCAFPGAPPPSVAGVPTTIVEVFASGQIGSDALNATELLANVTAAGYTAVMADAGRLYLDTGNPDPAVYFAKMWYDIGEGLGARGSAQRARLLGGSLNLWSDAYCSGQVECGGWAYCPGSNESHPDATECVPSTGFMQDAAQDAVFVQSAGGLLFPRANVGAGSFWRFDDRVGSNSSEILRRTGALARTMEERGVVGLCPQNCTCSFGDRCGQPYTKS